MTHLGLILSKNLFLNCLNVDISLIKRHNLVIVKCFIFSNGIAIYAFDIL